ncbi:MAG: ABC transporter permease, partial [Clostridia bacterium]|nr:ABC transporter permease [Clostridia bacterium]
MNQFFTIFRFECKSYLRNKIFIAVTLLFVIVIGAVLTVPAVIGEKETVTVERVFLFSDQMAESDVEAYVSMSYFSALPGYTFEYTDLSVEEIEASVYAGEADGAMILTGPLSYSYIVKNLSLYDSNTAIFNEVLVTKFRDEALKGSDLTEEEKAQIVAAETLVQASVIYDKNQADSFLYTYILVFGLYVVIIMYGQLVAQSVASEKSSRAMEILITSAKPTRLMFAKVLSAGLCGLGQLATILGSAVLFYAINRDYWSGNVIISSLFNIPVNVLLYMLLFFLLGYFIYAFVYAALGSLAGKAEDVSTLILPATYIVLFSIMVVIFSVASGSVDSTLMKICSYIPFTSPMAMFSRICMGS